MSARSWHGGVPAPPADIKREMFNAGRDGDVVALGILQDVYEAWLESQGYPRAHQGRPAQADEAAR